ncbi:tyrosine-protein phosphatase [Rhodococcus sp. T2V]|uniref:tyrosine-protein phosphatase n=1 Tax=Rhodococcus sp. T2V TaxID=3034164 RepID=UPI0023E305E9|nr:tyrosine-protein phosphatase [Rhodococcus sp. T2V]MDF3312498.1 tyrosine-protein phosphatase [Rhodococcus sp. T2V]
MTVDIVPTVPVNLRDLGGIPIAGGTLRKGLAIRADDLSLVTEEAARELVDGGLSAVIDLRTNDEVAITGRGPLAEHRVSYHHLSLVASVHSDLPTSDERAFVLEYAAIGELYVRLFETAAPQLASALSIIALTPGATAFHCAAGRDRTGVLAAALLLALGATDQQIVTDYARTDANMAAVLERLRPRTSLLMQRLGVNWDGTTQFPNEPMDVSMHILLNELRARHGDPLTPLRAAGLNDATIARLRERALTA